MRKKGESMRKHLSIIIGLFISIIFSMSLFACSPDTISDTSNTTSNIPSTSTSVEQPVLPTVTDVVAKVKPSVVAINVEITTYDIFNRPTTGEGAGSGWIISEDGYIVTNNHVVGDANKVTVVLEDGSSYTAEQVKTDALTDLAIVKIDTTKKLPAIKVGDSSKLEVGDWVIAIGNALGEGISATVGVVSALDVSVSASPGQTLHGLIQTDAAINPGNSGGPLVNMAGEVVGIDSIKVAEVGVEGMGYAISINQALPIINELIKTGFIVRPWIGIGVYTVDSSLASMYNLSVDKGVLITEVVSDSPAEKAGLEAGDIITEVEGKEITNIDDLLTLINTFEIGQTVQMSFWRNSDQKTASVTLAESPQTQ
jgi:serine protease Do